MKLIDYLKSLSRQERDALASHCGTSSDYLFQLAYGKRTPKAELAVAIDRASDGAVPCDELLPDVDWDYVRRQERAA